MLRAVEPDAAIVILLGAGAGRRLGGAEPKALLPIGGRPILAVAAAAAAAVPAGRRTRRDVPAGMGRTRARVRGGPRRSTSGSSRGATRGRPRSGAALAAVPESVDIVAVHDAARPFAPPDLFARVVQAVEEGADGAVPVLAVADTVLRVRGEVVEGVESREELVLGQTPQAFRTSVAPGGACEGRGGGRRVHRRRLDAPLGRLRGPRDPGRPGEREDHHAGRPRACGPPDGSGRWLISPSGSGSTSTASRRVARSGSAVSCSKASRGSSGHSDGDVVCHAIADALLGAVALGDVGEHFPDTDPETAGIDGCGAPRPHPRGSSRTGGRAPVSMDVTIVCERPAIAPRRLEMREPAGRDLGSPGRSRLRQGDPAGGARARPATASGAWRSRWSGERGARDRAAGRRGGAPSRPGPRGARRGRRAGHARAPGGPRGGPRGQGARPRDGTAGAGSDGRRSSWGRRADGGWPRGPPAAGGAGPRHPRVRGRTRSSSSWTGSRIRRTSGPRRGRPRRRAPRPSSPGVGGRPA